MIKKSLILILLIALGGIFFSLFRSFTPQNELPDVGKYYAENAMEQVGAANLVTAVVVTYRGLDTLGEVTILFLTAAIIAFFLKHTNPKTKEKESKPSEILQTASRVLAPIIFMVGVYIFINGHLTPGGGFQGGAVVASGVILLILSNPNFKLNHRLITVVESISGLSFVIIGVLGIFLAGGFLDNSLLSLGTFGTIFSAGAVPIIYIFVGLKVGSELANIVATMNQE